MKMEIFLARTILVPVLAVGLSAIASPAQEAQMKGEKSVSVTGCLQKGDEAGEYSITGADGNRYGLRSKTVDLSKHVGHKVIVTGTNEEKEKNGGEYADLLVTNLKMVSESCQ